MPPRDGRGAFAHPSRPEAVLPARRFPKGPALLAPRLRESLRENRRLARHRRALGYWAVLLGMWLSLWVGTSVQVREMFHLPFLFVHLASVIAGLGATVVLDAKAVQWVFGRATLGDVNRIEHAVTPLAWLGITGLLASGAFLAPDFSEPLTALKMVAVLIAGLNGVAVGKLADTLGRMPVHMTFRRVPTRLKWWCAGSATVSQVAWWSAVILGMMNTAID